MKSKSGIYLAIILVIFGIIYALISLVNHYYFRTYALDLGLYTNALYKYAHFHLADSSMFKNVNEYLLADHFDLYLIIFSPLVYLFGTYTLLLVQIAAILAGGAGIYKYFRLTLPENDFIPVAATLGFLSFFGIFSALAFDYHSNVVAAMLVPWLFYFFKKKNYIAAATLGFLILIAKENMALWLVFICLGLAVEYRKDRKSLAYLSAFSVFSVVYFIIIIFLVMPAFSASGNYYGFDYSALGQNPLEAATNLFLQPLNSIKILFTNHTNHPNGDYVKMELHIMVLLSGAFFLLLKPYYLIMLIPIYFQKMFHDSTQIWSVNGQYSIEFAPVLAIGVFTAIAEFKDRKIERILAAVALSGILISTVRLMDHTVAYSNKPMIRFYVAGHYKRPFDVKPVYRMLDQLPANARISALTPLVPHLALRDHIYQFPVIRDAEFIVYSENEGKYPLDEANFTKTINKINLSGEWEEVSNKDGVVILKKKTGDRSQNSEDQ
jgi:uncharacterized membrane protein